MKVPVGLVFAISSRGFLDVSRPCPPKPFHSYHARDATTINPIQLTLGYFQRLVQPGHGQTRFLETYPAIPVAVEWLLPLPLRDRRRLAGHFPSVILRLPKRGG